MGKMAELGPADAVAPIHTSLNFGSAGAGPQDGEKPKSPPTAGRAPQPHKPAWRLPLLPPLSVRNQRQLRKRRTATHRGEAGPLRGLSPIRLRRVVRPCGARPAEHVEYETWPIHPLGYARSPSRSPVDLPPGEYSLKRLQMISRACPRGEDLIMPMRHLSVSPKAWRRPTRSPSHPAPLPTHNKFRNTDPICDVGLQRKIRNQDRPCQMPPNMAEEPLAAS